MNLITNFTSWNVYHKELYAYLTNTLLIDSTIDAEIEVLMKNNTNEKEQLKSLLDLCITLCGSYIYHPVLCQFGFAKLPVRESYSNQHHNITSPTNHDDFTISDFQTGISACIASNYIDDLKEHIATSFYYSWEAYHRSPMSLYETIEYHMPVDIRQSKPKRKGNDPTDDKGTSSYETYKYHKYKQANNFLSTPGNKTNNKTLCGKFVRSYHIFPFINDNITKNGNRTFNPKPIDHELIFSLFTNPVYNPYSHQYYNNGCNYKNFSKLISKFNNLTLNLTSDCKIGDDLPPSSKIVCNNYLTERLLHFDFISFLIKEYNSIYNDNILYNDVFMILGELAVLPNVFSRNAMANNLLNAFTTTYNKDLATWTRDVRLFISFITKCTLPIMNLTFQFIMEYCSIKKVSEVAIRKKTTDNQILEIHNKYIQTVFNKYLQHQSISNKINIYTQVDKVVISTNSTIDNNTLYDIHNLCNPLSKLIFFKIMKEETFEAATIDYINPFSPEYIKKLQTEKINQLLKKSLPKIQ